MRTAREDWDQGHYAKAVGGFVARHWPTIAFIITLALFSWVTLRTYQLAQDNRELADSTQQALISNCENTRVPLTRYFDSEIATTRATDPSLFPDIPPTVFEQLVAQKVERIVAVVKVFDPDKCAESYR